MTTFSEQINNLAVRAATECKTLHTKIGTLANLNTNDKTAVVAAINEVKTQINSAVTSVNDLSTRLTTVEGQQSTNTGDIGTLKTSVSTLQSTLSTLSTKVDSLEDQIESATNIDDTKSSTTTTYSSSKIASEITAAKQAVKNDLLGGAGEAYDTLKELADLITTNQDAIEALQTIAGGAVRYDQAQSLTDTQKTQARSNVGAASAADLSTLQGTVTTMQTSVTKNTTDIKNLSDAIGDTSVDFVAAFETALNSESA
jgi:chromosome segregation ATPase